jgi:hypothetical protein
MTTQKIQVNNRAGAGIFIFIFFIVLNFFSVHSAHAGKHPYPVLIDRIMDDIRSILNRHGLPVERDRETPWLACSAVPGKYTIYYFQADDIPQDAKMETIKYLMELYKERGETELFRLKIYKETEDEERPLFSGVQPFFELTIGGQNK